MAEYSHPLDDSAATEAAREYLRRCLAFDGLTPLLVGGLICAAIGGLVAFPAVIPAANFWPYLLIVLVVSRELAGNWMRKRAQRNGTHPHNYPPPPESLAYVNGYVRVAKVLQGAFWVFLVGGFVADYALKGKTPLPIAQCFSMLVILSMLLGNFWDFFKTGLWEKLLMAGCLCAASYSWWFPKGPMNPIISVLIFGGGFAVAGAFLLARWWAWAKTVARDPSAEGPEEPRFGE